MGEINWDKTLAASWRSRKELLKPVLDVDLHDMDRLLCIDKQKHAFTQNLERFMASEPNNHVLLWVRGAQENLL